METDEAGTVITEDGLSVETNAETSEAMKANFDSEQKPLDGESEDPKAAEKKKRSEAAAELGKAGGEATAKAKAEKDDLEVDAEDKPEKTEPEVKEATAKEEPEPEKTEPEKDESLGADPRSNAQARMKQATKKLAEERDRNRALEARMDAIEAGQAPEKTETAKAPEKPVRAQYAAGPDGDGEFIEALTDWKTDQKVGQMREEDRRQAVVDGKVKADVQKVDTFNERLAAAAEAANMTVKEWTNTKIDPDISDMCPTFLVPPGTPVTPENDIAQAVVDSDYTAELLLYLSAHPEEMVRLTGLPDTNAVFRAMGALEAKVTAEPPSPRLAPEKESEPQMSKAKPPVTPVSGSAQVSEEDVTDDMDLDTHMRIYNAKDERARRGR